MGKIASKLTQQDSSALSVKDYIKIGQSHTMCPYYLMKTQIKNCDVAVIPYNYVIDKELRSYIGIPFENSVIIFDEGHNINQFCEDLYTFELSI